MTTIRNMTFEELQTLVDWAAAEGWNPGIHDAECFWGLDPDGFLAMDQDGQFIGGGAIIKHGDSFGFMGLFIVAPAFRGQGLGTQLWFARRDRLLARLKPDATIGLDAVDAMIPFYEAGGFKQFARQRRYSLERPLSSVSTSAHVAELRKIDLSSVLDYDRRCFPERRSSIMPQWITRPGTISRGFLTNGMLSGFGVMRRCVTGLKIGPLFADSLEIADQLFQSLVDDSQGQPVFLDAPDDNPAAIELCRQHQMKEVFGCVRMYHGPVPDIDNNRIFGITTFEVG